MLERAKEIFRHPAFQRQPVRVAARLPWWVFHCVTGRPTTVKFNHLGFVMHLPPVWHGGGATAAFVFRDYAQPDLLFLRRFLKPGMTVLEGGASTGLYTLTAASLVGPSGRVVAFEPGRRSAEALAKSVALNGFSQVAIRREALSAVQSTSTLYYHRPSGQHVGVRHR